MNYWLECVFCGKQTEVSIETPEDIVRTCHNCGIRHYDDVGVMAQYYVSRGGNGFYVQVPSGTLLVKQEVAV